ncbi:glycosyltransferase [bacterium]|nr:glycosyltransferase [bacterium]
MLEAFWESLFVAVPLWVQLVSLAAAALGLGQLLFALAAIVLQRRGPGSGHSTVTSAYTPSCAVIIPTKGLPERAALHFGSALRQDYPDYEVYFVVEAESDPGAPFLRELIAGNPRAHLVVAGMSTACSQKNHNMLAGVKAAGEVEVLAFADNDVELPADWLRRLVAPLASEKVAVSSGFRWIEPERGDPAAQAHVLMNAAMYSYMSVLAAVQGNFVWGGSFALRRETYARLGVAPRWAETFSDDMALAEILFRSGERSVLVPGLMLHSDEAFRSLGQATGWFRRQVLCLKAHYYNIWRLAGLPVFLFTAGLYIFLPVALAGALLTGGSFWNWGGGAPLTFFALEGLTHLAYGCLGRVRHLWRFVLSAPLLLATLICGFLLTLGDWRMRWSGATYVFNRQGKVVRVERR